MTDRHRSVGRSVIKSNRLNATRLQLIHHGNKFLVGNPSITTNEYLAAALHVHHLLYPVSQGLKGNRLIVDLQDLIRAEAHRDRDE